MTTINFYNYDGHPDTVNKVLGEPTAYNGNLRQDIDVLRPVLTLKKAPSLTFNYCYIPDLHRYYFIDSVVYVGNNTYEVSLSVDVLKTYETQILDATATVQESDTPQPYISTRRNVYDQQPHFEKIDFPNTGLFNADGTIVMVTIKGQ